MDEQSSRKMDSNMKFLVIVLICVLDYTHLTEALNIGR